MNDKKCENLYVATRDFLVCIKNAQLLYYSQKFTIGEESLIRIKLNHCFEQYLETLLPKEYNFGPVMTRRSREVVDLMITEFFESEYCCHTKVGQDLSTYYKMITDSLARTVVML